METSSSSPTSSSKTSNNSTFNHHNLSNNTKSSTTKTAAASTTTKTTTTTTDTATASPSSASTLTSDELKEKGNICVRNGNYEDALKLYTKAIKLNPKDSALYSNRSLVFLKLKQYWYASNDADTVIQLNSTWAKGHYRKAEVLTAVGHYDTALLYYGRALQLQQGDRSLLQAAQKAAKLGNQQTDYERRLPWVGAGIGIIIGVIISLCDTLLTVKPTLKHPAIMVLLVIVVAGIGYIIARSIRYYQRIHKRSLLEQPLNINFDYQTPFSFTQSSSSSSSSTSTSSSYTSNNSNCNLTGDKGETESDNNEMNMNRNRYSKAQARLRFKKGKS